MSEGLPFIVGHKLAENLHPVANPAVDSLGNIYASEILFDCSLSPQRAAGTLDVIESAALLHSTKAILRKAVPPHVESIEAHLAGPLGEDVATLEALMRIVRDANGPGVCPGPAS